MNPFAVARATFELSMRLATLPLEIGAKMLGGSNHDEAPRRSTSTRRRSPSTQSRPQSTARKSGSTQTRRRSSQQSRSGASKSSQPRSRASSGRQTQSRTQRRATPSAARVQHDTQPRPPAVSQQRGTPPEPAATPERETPSDVAVGAALAGSAAVQERAETAAQGRAETRPEPEAQPATTPDDAERIPATEQSGAAEPRGDTGATDER